MKTVLLYGEYGKKFGREHHFQVQNVAEAIRALRANYPEFGPMMGNAHLKGIGFRIIVGTEGLTSAKETFNPSSDKDTIKIVPVIFGSGGVFKVLLGAVLVAGAVIVGIGSVGTAGAVSTAMLSMGAGLIIGGVAQLLTSPPTVATSKDGEQKQSSLFNGPENTTAQGGPVPVGYGRLIVGSVTISAGIDTDES